MNDRPSHPLAFSGVAGGGTRPLLAAIERLVIAGWTGRDAATVEAHIEELARLGVARPKTTPIFYRVAATLLTTGGAIEVAGPDTSGEVEPVVVSLADGLWVGVGSDHTDRRVEATGVTLSKQLCAKPVAPSLWRYEEVAGHWDRLVLRSFMTKANHRRLYQEGSVAALRPPLELMEKYLNKKDILPPGSVMFGGTLAVPGGLEPADRFEIEMEDPILGRTLSHAYDILILPVEG
jgi:hypothetical protein